MNQIVSGTAPKATLWLESKLLTKAKVHLQLYNKSFRFAAKVSLEIVFVITR